ncbi:MAG: hypothetical protein LBR94_06995 [Desulfovibrio sp.]|jgi:septal ring factor EnvC (AmiA/AmiB activator)|nr:hypothetical protein [Desulfovibrio sp.]
MAGKTSDAPSMEQVRELLMGTPLKDMENHIQRQEERFMREVADMRASVKNRVESLENFMKSEMASLLHRLQEEQTERAAAIKNEQKERAESLKTEQRERNEAMKKDRAEREQALAQLAKNLSQTEEALERKLAALSGTLDTAEQELRKLMLAESARASDKLEEKYKDALDTIVNTAAELRHDLVSRSALSALFTATAIKLSGEWSLASPVESGAKGSNTEQKAT